MPNGKVIYGEDGRKYGAGADYLKALELQGKISAPF